GVQTCALPIFKASLGGIVQKDVNAIKVIIRGKFHNCINRCGTFCRISNHVEKCVVGIESTACKINHVSRYVEHDINTSAMCSRYDLRNVHSGESRIDEFSFYFTHYCGRDHKVCKVSEINIIQ